MTSTAAMLTNIGDGAYSYDEFLAGIGKRLFAINPDWLIHTPKYAKDGSANFQSFSFDAANFYSGKYALMFYIKKQSGQNQATGNEGPKGYGQSLTFTIEKDVKRAAQTLRLIKNHEDFYFLAEEAGGQTYQVIGDPTYGSKLNNNYDTGTTPDSDMGHSVTVTSSPSIFSLVNWTPATEAATTTIDDALPSGLTLTGKIPTMDDPSTSSATMPGESSDGD